jgi:putative CocE/NonD family hydrolase
MKRAYAAAAAAILLALAGPASAAPPESGVYVTMRDGVKIAADVVLTPAAQAGGKSPVMMQVTRYGRGGRDPKAVQAYIDAGFNVIGVDARGSGVSYGWRRSEFSPEEFDDIAEMIAWAGAQPWSNGSVVMTGNSYTGDTAETATATGRPELKASLVRHSEYDAYRHLTFPGGVKNQMIVTLWGQMVGADDLSAACMQAFEACKTMGHIKPVDGDADYTQARAAIAGHQINFRADRDLAGIYYRDDVMPSGVRMDQVNTNSRAAAIAQAKTPVQVWGSWFDAGMAASALERFQTLPGVPTEVFIASWTHGGGHSVDPFFPVEQANVMEKPEQFRRQIGFLTDALAGRLPPHVIHYVPIGTTKWRDTPVWPPMGIKVERHALVAPGLMSRGKPATEGTDVYAVDFTASVGKQDRYRTQLGGLPVRYPDRAAADRKLLVYDGEAMSRDVELAGRPKVQLKLSVDAIDAAVFAYLEDVAPDGAVTYLTEGKLRLASRKPGPNVDGEPSFNRADALPVIPGEVMEITVLLEPVAAKIGKGHRLRLAIAGADADTFARYPAEGPLTFTVHRGGAQPSALELPLRPWAD